MPGWQWRALHGSPSVYIGLHCGNCGGREERGPWTASNCRRQLDCCTVPMRVPKAKGREEEEGSSMQPSRGHCSLE